MSIERTALFAVSLLVVLAVLAYPGEPSPGVPVFGDDFSVPGLFVENWEVSKGVRCEGDRAVIPVGNHLDLRRIVEGDFAVTADWKIGFASLR